MTKEEDKKRYIHLVFNEYPRCDTPSEHRETCERLKKIEDNYDTKTLSDWIDEGREE